MIKHIIKDVSTVQMGIVAHGCNCQGVMGAGVARAVRQTWPKAYSEYVQLCRNYTANEKSHLLGMAQMVQVGKEEGFEELYVANCLTQLNYGSDGKVYADIAAIEEAFDNIVAFAVNKDLPIYMPKIGCGLGGLDWSKDVEPLLVKCVENIDVVVYVCDIK